MIGNHLKALILLLQDELRSQRLLGHGAWRRYGVCLGVGHSSGNGHGIRTRRGDCAAYKNSQLRHDATEKHLLVALHMYTPRFKNHRMIGILYQDLHRNRYIFGWYAAPIALANNGNLWQRNKRS